MKVSLKVLAVVSVMVLAALLAAAAPAAAGVSRDLARLRELERKYPCAGSNPFRCHEYLMRKVGCRWEDPQTGDLLWDLRLRGWWNCGSRNIDESSGIHR